MIAETYVRFDPPILLDLRIRIESEEHDPEMSQFTELPLVIHLDAVARTITAHLPPVPVSVPLYGPADFIAACPDMPEDHADRVLQVLGSDPAKVLQELCHGGELPPMPPRIPREIPNWRAKVILAQMGLLSTVETAIESLSEPERTVARLAWNGDAKLARRGKTVLGLASALGLSSDQIDNLFIAAEALEV